MNRKTRLFLTTLVALAVLRLITGNLYAASYRPANITPPKFNREFRGAWVATVDNIDWPTKGASTADQKADLVAILDRAAELKLNTIVFQVRPACDALYASTLEPWSEYLTGVMGKAPQPFYDPLAFAIQEAHKRGLELHAWFNPYRARLLSAKSPVSANHISRTHPELVRRYGEFLWLDPGEKAVQDYSLKVVMDVVNRYDVDGVHFDDYFYPYDIKNAAGKPIDFPDEQSWKRAGARSGLSREDWRRENVNDFIQRVYSSIKSAKPWVKFGISPFGIWRPGTPPQIQGYDAYDRLYADSRKWLAKGWCDYFAPQLYWAIEPPEQSFPVLLKWWTEQNAKGRQVIAGMDSTKAKRTWKPDEIVNQIRLTRKTKAAGHIHWNMSSLMRNPALGSALQRAVYTEPAAVPPVPWLRRTAPRKPELAVAESSSGAVTWRTTREEPITCWVLQTRTGKSWKTVLVPGGQISGTVEGKPNAVSLIALDRYGNASAPTVVSRP